MSESLNNLPERTIVEERFAASQRRVEDLALAVSSIVWRFDAKRRKISSRGFVAFTGCSEEPADETAWLALIHAGDREGVRERNAEAMAVGQSYTLVYRLRHGSGDYRWVEDRAVPILGQNDHPGEWMGVITDVHERVLAEDALRDSEERLRLATSAGTGRDLGFRYSSGKLRCRWS